MWILVAFASALLGISGVFAPDPIYVTEDLDFILKELSAQRRSTTTPLPTSTPPFSCEGRRSGIYPDVKSGCQIIRLCSTDGRDWTLDCQNKTDGICGYKGFLRYWCERGEEEPFLPYPAEDIFNLFQIMAPSAILEPTEPTKVAGDHGKSVVEDNEEEEKKEISSIQEVSSSFLKEIKSMDTRPIITEAPHLRPATFSRGVRPPPSSDHQDALIDVAPTNGRRFDGDDAYLVEVSSNPIKLRDDYPDNDISSFSRKPKRLSFKSPEKLALGKHPRRRKRTVVQHFDVSRPYAIIYAKVPDTTSASSRDSFLKDERVPQGSIQLPISTSYRTADNPLIPITIETHYKKKSKSKKKTPPSTPSQPDSDQRPKSQQQSQQTSEQQNIYFYAPDQEDSQQDQRTNSQQTRPSADSRQHAPEPEVASGPRQPSGYSPQQGNSLLVPNFMQTRPFLQSPRQSPFYFSAPDFHNGGYSPYQMDTGSQVQRRPQQSPAETSARSPAQGGSNSRPGSNYEDRRVRPANPELPISSSGRYQSSPNAERPRPQSVQGPGAYTGFQSPFFNNFAPFGSAPFNGPYAPQNTGPYSLLPPGLQLPGVQQPGVQQPAAVQPGPGRFLSQGRPQYSQPEPAPVGPQVFTRPEVARPEVSRRPEVPVILQPVRETPGYPQGVPQSEGSGRPRENAAPSHSQRPSRPREQPASVPQPETQAQTFQRPPEDPRQQRPSQDSRPQRPSQDSRPQRPSQDSRSQRPSQDHRPQGPSQDSRPQRPSQDTRLQPPHQDSTPQRIRQPSPYDERIVYQPEYPEHGIPNPAVEDIRYQSRPRPENQNTYVPREPVPQRQPEPPQSTFFYAHSNPSSQDGSMRPLEEEYMRERAKPLEDVRVSVDRARHRTTEAPENVRSRPENTPPVNRYYVTAPPPSNINSRPQPPPSRHREIPRDQNQIERPPPGYALPEPTPDIYSGPHSFFTYPPQGNDVNVVSTVEDSDIRTHSPQSQPARRPSDRNRTPDSNIRGPSNHVNLENGFNGHSVTELPRVNTQYGTRAPSNSHDRQYSTRENYQKFDDNTPTTKPPTTTRRPRKPPPPKPTFPTFPSFPPPPRRPLTTPKPIPDEPDTTDRSSSYVRGSSDLGPHDLASDKLSETATNEPEVTTRRRVRKRRPKPRKPRPSSPEPDAESPLDTHAQTSSTRDLTTRPPSSRGSNRWRQQPSVTSPPRKASTEQEEQTTTATYEKSDEFGSRINLFGRQRARKPTSFQPRTTTPSSDSRDENPKPKLTTRERKPFAKRVRVRTSTTASPDDENEEVLNYQQSEDFNSYVTPLEEVESGTIPYEFDLEVVTTEPYEEDPNLTQISEDQQDEQTEDYDSNRSLASKAQNRPRILKFGKPKLKSTAEV